MLVAFELGGVFIAAVGQAERVLAMTFDVPYGVNLAETTLALFILSADLLIRTSSRSTQALVTGKHRHRALTGRALRVVNAVITCLEASFRTDPGDGVAHVAVAGSAFAIVDALFSTLDRPGCLRTLIVKSKIKLHTLSAAAISVF
jgi:hypothetical protein